MAYIEKMSPSHRRDGGSSTGLLVLVAIVLAVMALSVAYGEKTPETERSTVRQEIWHGNSAHLPELFPEAAPAH